MKKTLKKTMTFLFVGALLALMASAAMANTDSQALTLDVNEIAVLDATASTPATIALTVTAPAAGGDSVVLTGTPNATSYAQYTSVVDSAETRTISAQLASDVIPAGLKLNLTAGTPTGTGTVGSEVALGEDFTNGDTGGGDIITAIGSCETGSETTDGAQLTYTLSVTDISSVVATATQVSITVNLTMTATD